MTTMEGLGDRDHKYLKKESKLDPCLDGRNNKVNDESSNQHGMKGDWLLLDYGEKRIAVITYGNLRLILLIIHGKC